MARKSAAARREEILAATVDEIEATGLRALRVSDVAASLGLSASLVIYHFETKEALVAAAFDFAGRNDLDHARALAGGRDVSGPTSALNRLRAVIGWYMPSGSSRSWRIWIDAWSAGLFDEGLKSTFAALDQEWKSILTGLIAEAATEASSASGESVGEAPTEPTGAASPETSATRILAYLDGLAVRLLFDPDALSPAQLSAWVDDFLGREVG